MYYFVIIDKVVLFFCYEKKYFVCSYVVIKDLVSQNYLKFVLFFNIYYIVGYNRLEYYKL